MDQLGKTVRELLRAKHEKSVRGALLLAKMFQKEGMDKSQVEEMLFANEFEKEVVTDAMKRLEDKK